jgi:hypothetical protein
MVAVVLVIVAVVIVFLSVLGEVQFVLQPARASEDVRVVRILIALTGNLDLAKLVFRVQLCLALPLNVVSIKPPIMTRDHARLAAVGTPRTASHTLELGDGG